MAELRILVVNAGSSSLKLRVLAGHSVLASADLPGEADAAAVADAVAGFGVVEAVGHRIVHGGTKYRSPVLVDARVRADLGALTDLAPLHQPKSLAALDTVSSLLPAVPAVASFDTAFHSTLPPFAYSYALPAQWRERWGLRKFGFHGLSHAYASSRVARLLGRDDARIVVCHLGAGASLCAVRDGRSVDTTMGFTPLDGLVMATRSGSVDPGLVLWLESHAGLGASELADALEHRSGLAGLAGSEDMRTVLALAASDDPGAVLARDVYLHRLRSLIGSMAAVLDGLDALVFTGGVGENSAEVRERTLAGLGYLGLTCDSRLNESGPADREIGETAGPTRAFVVTAREDLQIAGEVSAVLS